MMIKNIYRDLLGKTYDLEGLLLLMLSRKDISIELASRIEEKIIEISNIASNNEVSETIDLDDDEEDYDDAGEDDYEYSEDPEEDQDLIEEEEEAPNPVEMDLLESKEPETRIDEPKKEFPEETSVENGEVFESKSPKKQFPLKKTVIPPETVAAIKEEFSHFYSLADDEEEQKSNPLENPPAKEISKESEKPIITKRKAAPSFSLNDRFLYTRELFKGDASAFKAAIEKISRFDNYEEAEAYFITNINLDPETRETDKAFLYMIKTYLSESGDKAK